MLTYLLSFLIGALLAVWPIFFKNISSFLDTLIHEAGHGLASLPFGAPLPAITVRKNSSGETQSTMGYLHQLLPFGLGTLTEKIARTLSLMAGYSASIIFAALLLVIASTPTVTFEPWQLLFLVQIALATVLWTLVRITDSPWTFGFVAIAATGLYLALFPWDWRIYGAAVLGAVILFFLARAWLSSIAVILTLTSPLVPIFGLMLSDDFFRDVFGSLALTIDSLWLSRIIFGVLLVFLLFCCRSLLSLGLTALIIGASLGLLFIPGLPHGYVLFGLAGMLSVAGAKSLMELHRITFRQSSGHWQRERTATDMVFAADEIGGDPRYWYWVQVAVAALGALGILIAGILL